MSSWLIYRGLIPVPVSTRLAAGYRMVPLGSLVLIAGGFASSRAAHRVDRSS